MLRHESIATIDAPQFVNLAPNAINPGISECEIKVLYLGENRNGSVFSREVAEEMANTLPGTPIVGAYHKDIDDFGDHGDVIHVENGEISFSCATVPYGFVAPDTKVWFKDYVEADEHGQEISRTYLMATGYLWTGQYPEIERCVSQGMGQSMELDSNMDGTWTTNEEGIDFFIVTDATFTKLCVLGDAVEPCFEGASVEAPKVSTAFSNDSFSRAFYDMMCELKFALQEGGSDMTDTIETEAVKPEVEVAEDTAVAEEFAEEIPAEVETAEVEAEVETPAEEFAEEEKKDEEETEDSESEKDEEEPEEDEKKFSKKEPEEESEDEPESTDEDESKDESKDEPESADEDKDEKKEPENKHAIAELQAAYDSLLEEVESLRQFKAERVSADKDALIAKYHMLSDEDKAEVIDNKDSLSMDEIESKLALIYVNKNVDFETIDGSVEVADAPASTFSVESIDYTEEVDPFIAALREATNL